METHYQGLGLRGHEFLPRNFSCQIENISIKTIHMIFLDVQNKHIILPQMICGKCKTVLIDSNWFFMTNENREKNVRRNTINII